MAPRKDHFRRSPRRALTDDENQPELNCDGTLSPDQEAFPRQELLASLAKLRLDPQYSDLTITCGDQVYWVHKSIICPRSAFSAKACHGNFQEAYANKVTLQEEPALVRQMIEYLYTLDYQVDTLSESAHFTLKDVPTDLTKSGTAKTDSAYQAMVIRGDQDSLNTSKSTSDFASYGCDPLSFHILMYALADRMFIEGLKGLSKRKVEQELLQRLDASSFPSGIVEIYNSTPSQDRGLRDLAVRVL
ncbi:hypothetical protein PMG11_11134 [Penicillium brasilianum]|uniref:BTB domain-containing protein n=1 Tax=Penicillium brasilianum TaxID=104259 RepID=A0A0F7U112_PENBI|nr:hypothetical protein PMG11_11134 [Penicillium brasilianum]